MSLVTLENNFIKLAVSSLGAEWKKILAFGKSVDCLWSRKSEWPRQAPVLFPIVGRLKENSYIFDSNTYSMAQHGFARDSEFSIIQQNQNKASLFLKTCPLTEKVYPFQWELEIVYELIDHSLQTTYIISNLNSTRPLPFSIGAHPGFSYDWLSKTSSLEEIYIEFEGPEKAFHLLKEGLLDLNTSVHEKLHDKKLYLRRDLFAKDALILNGIVSQWVQIGADSSRRKIRVEFERPVAFGLWSKSIEHFICLEPWWGMPDLIGHNQNFEDKVGLTWLKHGAVWKTGWKVHFYDE